MRRRSFLATTGSVLGTVGSGCLGGENGGANGGDETARLRIRSVTPDSAPDLSVAPTVSVAEPEETAEKPASIAVRWANEGEKSLRLGEARSVSFQTAKSDDGSAYLLGDRWREWDETVAFDDCWYVSGTIAGDGEYQVVELEPSETFEESSDLYADDSTCLAGGTYRFQTLVSVNRFTEGDEHADTAEWGLVLDVETES